MSVLCGCGTEILVRPQSYAANVDAFGALTRRRAAHACVRWPVVGPKAARRWPSVVRVEGMKRLILMRHAKTEGHNADGDRARELLPRGRNDSAAVGHELAGLGLQYAMVSTAMRTRQTFEALGLAIPAEFQEVLYSEGPDTMLQRISETDDDITGLLVVGHAPTIPSLSAQLSFASNPGEADALQCSFPTASFAEFTFEGEWADLERDNLEHVSLQRVERPDKA